MSSGEVTARHYKTGQPVRLSWQNGQITAVAEMPADTAHGPTFIAPALFDIQVNGYGAVDFQQDNLTETDLIRAARALRRAGCTRFLCTFITAEWPKLIARMRHARAIRASSPELQQAIVGWHIEGPFLSDKPGFCGAHDPAVMFDPTERHITELRDAMAGDAVLLTMAPERPGAIAAIRCATRLGMRVSLGHTDASAEVLSAARDAGATGFTHLANGCPRELDRHDNIVWRVLDTEGLTPSFIPDRIHVSPAPFRAMHRALGERAVLYTTDAMSAAGAPPGRYTIGTVEVEVGPDQIVRQPGKTNFAGSALQPLNGVMRAAQMLDAPWQQAWERFSVAPAGFMGIASGLQSGARADFCLVRAERDRLSLVEVVANGARSPL